MQLFKDFQTDDDTRNLDIRIRQSLRGGALPYDANGYFTRYYPDMVAGLLVAAQGEEIQLLTTVQESDESSGDLLKLTTSIITKISLIEATWTREKGISTTRFPRPKLISVSFRTSPPNSHNHTEYPGRVSLIVKFEGGFEFDSNSIDSREPLVNDQLQVLASRLLSEVIPN